MGGTDEGLVPNSTSLSPSRQPNSRVLGRLPHAYARVEYRVGRQNPKLLDMYLPCPPGLRAPIPDLRTDCTSAVLVGRTSLHRKA